MLANWGNLRDRRYGHITPSRNPRSLHWAITATFTVIARSLFLRHFD
ncbi:hypothetical protein [Calothrix sp. NIES-2100]